MLKSANEPLMPEIFLYKYWVSILILVLGLVAFIMLLAANQVKEWQYRDSLYTTATMELQVDITTFHLWLEEYLAGDKSVELGKTMARIQSAEELIDILLNGGATLHGTIFEPLKNQLLRGEAEKVKRNILKLHEITDLRLEKMEGAGIGTTVDQRFDMVFKNTLDILRKFELDFIEKGIKNRSRNRSLLLGVFLIWPVIIFIALIGVILSQQRRRHVEKTANEYLDVVGVILLALDRNGLVTMINKKGCSILEYDYGEIIGKNWFKNFLPDRIRAKAILDSQKMFAGGIESVEYLENPVLTGSGKERIVAWHNTTLRDRSGKITGLLISGDDITEHKLAVAALKESENRLHSLVNNCTAAIYMKDTEYRYILINSTYEKLFEISNNEVKGKTAYDIFPKDVADSFQANDQKVFVAGASIELEEIVLHDDGPHTYLSTKFPLRNASGEVYAVCGISTDITGRKKAEDALYTEKNKLEAVTGSMNAGLCLLDSELKLVWVNNVFMDWFGSEVGGLSMHCKHIYKVKCLECSDEECIPYHARVSGQVKEAEVLTTRVDGERRYYRVIATPIKNTYGKVTDIVELIVDITDRKKAEEELRKLERLQSIGILADGIAHDYNNIMASVIINIGLAQMYLDPLHEPYKILASAEKAALKGSSLSNQLRILSSGGTPAKKTVLDLSKLLKESVDFALSGSNILLDIQLPDDLWQVKADEGQLRQVISNLVLNGSKAMPDGGTMSVSAKNIEITGKDDNRLKEGRYVCVSIVDNGEGIPDDIRGKLFDPYFTTRGMGNGAGTGLGLAIVHSIIIEHGGYVGFDSRVGEGTTFYFYLPACSEVFSEAEEPVKAVMHEGNARILILEDDEQIYSSLPRLFDKLGYEAVVATEGSEAIRVYKEAMANNTPFNAVMLDLVIRGGIGGKGVIAELLKVDPEVVALVSSGLTQDPVVLEYKKYGFKGVLTKPYSADKLKAVLHKLLSNGA